MPRERQKEEPFFLSLFVYTMSQVQICTCTRICVWRMYITWLLSELVYEVLWQRGSRLKKYIDI